MTKEMEKISAWYDGEVTQQEFDASLSDLNASADAKKTLHQFALLSELTQDKRHHPQISLTYEIIFLEIIHGYRML